MAIKFEKIQAGTTLYSKQRRKVGNTKRSEEAWFPVSVREVDASGRRVLASTNNNPERWVSEKYATKWCSAESYAKAQAKKAER